VTFGPATRPTQAPKVMHNVSMAALDAIHFSLVRSPGWLILYIWVPVKVPLVVLTLLTCAIP